MSSARSNNAFAGDVALAQYGRVSAVAAEAVPGTDYGQLIGVKPQTDYSEWNAA